MQSYLVIIIVNINFFLEIVYDFNYLLSILAFFKIIHSKNQNSYLHLRQDYINLEECLLTGTYQPFRHHHLKHTSFTQTSK